MQMKFQTNYSNCFTPLTNFHPLEKVSQNWVRFRGALCGTTDSRTRSTLRLQRNTSKYSGFVAAFLFPAVFQSLRAVTQRATTKLYNHVI